MRSRRGIALLMVVALLALLSVAAGMTALSARTSASSAFASLERLELRASIDSVVARAAIQLADENDGTRWRADGRLYEIAIGDIELDIRIVAENGRFDLNQGNPEILAALLEEIEISPLAARRISGAFADWRDEDDDVGQNGAESAAYRADNRPPPGNRPFIAVEEFRNVLGVDRDVFSRVEPYLTLYGTEAVSAEIAPPLLIEAAGVSSGDARRILSARARGGEPPEIDGSAGFDPDQPAVYAIFIEAEAGSGARMAREVIIHLPGEEDLYDVLSRHSHVFGYAEFLNPEPDA
ncbi:general secretion pathway protein GspK [Hyphobacterium sp.]|uniref:general secretion pathway protein GspK n=1 Tax=Hyphobacterium sp. TaxID=2004662 RepID=UPI003BAC8E52